MSNGYTYVWEFHVRPDSLDDFERHYGPNGSWVRLFRQAGGYVETLLLKDRAAGRYLTVDRWASREAHDAFRSKFSREYEALDRVCEGLTLRETPLGTFDE